MQNERVAFEEFRFLLARQRKDKRGNDTLVDITNEIEWMSQVRIVLDELNILKYLFDTQKKKFGYLRDLLHSSDSRSIQPSDTQEMKETERYRVLSGGLHHSDMQNGTQSAARDLGDCSAGASEGSKISPRSLEKSPSRSDVGKEHDADSTDLPDNYHRLDSIEDRKGSRLGPIWTLRRDGLLLNDVYRSLEDVEGMMERANRAYKSVSTLCSSQRYEDLHRRS